MSSCHRQAVFSRLDGCMFGFYSDDEIRKLSTVEIKELKGLSVLSLGEPNGLHDPRMGTLSGKQQETCPTCGGSHWSCPGHIGRIELAVQIYNPAVFKFVDAILTRKCYNCHQLLFDDTYIKVIHHKLETIDNGYLFNINSVQSQILKLQALTKDAKDKKKKKKKRNGKNENDSDSDGELAIDVVSDMQSSDDDSINSSNSQHTETEKKNAASSKINLDFLDEGIFAGTRQALLQLRWQLFQLIFKKWQPLDQCTYCQCVRMLFAHSEHSHIIQKPIGRGRRIKIYQQSQVKLVNINDTTQTMDVDKNITIPVSDVQKHFEALWRTEPFIMTRLFAVHPFHTNNHGKHAQYDICTDYQQFFVKVIAVPPNRYRPPRFTVNRTSECAQNRKYRNILKANIAMKEIFKQITELTTHPLLKKYTEEEKVFADKDELIAAEGLFAKYQESRKQFIQKWELLQQHYNHLTDSTKNEQLYRSNRPGTNATEPGIRQLIEKKQGLFRMFMMGKRVNYAARSVVNPELWIKTNEIGIPLYAAKILTYPDRVQSHNYYELRQAILNGPDIHPGANSVTDGWGRRISLKFKSLPQRTAIARTLLSNMSINGHSQSQEKNPAANRPQIVERHLRNNDIVLVNRQPTLHKVGIMAHRVRVQHKGKVIRMHYANCNSYNADFDGDEINVHFPQSEIARSEAYNIAATDKQYVSVKDGSPLRGLMQDHVVSSVLLTKKDTFLSKDEYTQLLFSCMQTWNPAMKIRMEAPTVLKPKQLWTGKQVINTLLNAISGNLDGINMEKKTRTPANAWNGIESCRKEEGLLIVRDNYICGGILDKSQISDGQSFGLIHAIHELYGPHAASTFLTSLGQLLSTYLQSHGFSARMEDLILTEKTELQRQSIIKNSFKKSVLRCAESVGYNVDKNNKQRSYVGVINAMKKFVLSDDKNEHKLDGEMRSTLAEITNAVIDNCYPFGSFIPFPINNFQLMILAGAKGSTVNMAQIVALLGQQELEGHRVPRMVSGKTLPCFAAYDPCGRSGGFVTQRFLTGLRPQEYYFHSMAGREGLVDTACKTSRSGYLQRCLIKGLETLHIAYDNTVRDCNQNIIQFLYGEDSLDTSKASYLDVNDCRKYSFFAKNKNIIEKKVKKGMFDEHELKLIFEDRDKFLNKPFFENMPESKLNKILSADIKRADDTAMDFRNARMYMFQWHKYRKKHKIDNCDPCLNIYNPALHFGSVSESYFNRIKQFIKTFHSNTKLTLKKNKRFQKEFGIKTLDFEDLMKINYAKALVESGEMVGILAAQSIGEPSTQMTLNTFHLAGFGDRNVTLGIPRMREILMTEGKNIKTPDMSFWISADIQQPMDAAIKLKNALQPLSLATLLTSRSIQGPDVVHKDSNTYKRVYTIELIIAVPKASKDASVKGVLRCLQKQFLPTLLRLIGVNASKSAATSASKIDESQNIKDDEYNIQQMQEEKEEKSKKVDGNVEEEESDDVDADSNHSDSDLDAHSEEEKESELEDESVLFGATDTDTVTDKDDVGLNKMPNLVTTTDDDFSDYAADKKKKKHKKNIFKDNDKLQQELALKYNTFRSVSIVIDEPRILCSLQIELPLNHEPLLLQSLIDKVCRNYAFVRKINNIDSVHIQYDKNGGYGGSNWKIIISGFNTAVFKLVEKYVDLRSFESNSIYQIYLLYGIEAARNSIIKELLSVLGAYGLNVSFRHLSLIADAMTYFGEIQAMSRKSMAKSTSPFLRVTYETAQNFLNDSCLNKDIDNISSPSSAIVLGQVGKFGTGLFDIKQDIKQLIKIQTKQKNNPYHQQSYYSDEEEECHEYDNDNDNDYDDGYFSKNQK